MSVGANLTLKQILDTASAEELHKQLIKVLEADKLPLIDASKVEKMSTSAVQILVAAQQFAEKSGGTILISSPTDLFKSAFSTLGLGETLKKMAG